MKKPSKTQWQERIINLAQNLPIEIHPDDQTMMQMLTEVIIVEQARLKPNNLHMLTCIAAALLARVHANFSTPSHITENGTPVYTEKQVATHLNISLDELRRAAEEMEEESSDATKLVITDIDPRKLFRVN